MHKVWMNLSFPKTHSWYKLFIFAKCRILRLLQLYFFIHQRHITVHNWFNKIKPERNYTKYLHHSCIVNVLIFGSAFCFLISVYLEIIVSVYLWNKISYPTYLWVRKNLSLLPKNIKFESIGNVFKLYQIHKNIPSSLMRTWV